ncbi:Cell division ATP-binding protein FtsE [compost metagenome]
MIRIEGLHKQFGDRAVLHDLSLKLEAGQFAYLQGRSGSGKSTLLKLLYRDIEDYKGSIEIDGKPLNSMKKYELRRKMGIIFQSYELLEQKTVAENIALAGEVRGAARKQLRSEMDRLLQRVGLKGREHDYPDQLSGGEQQRVAIVRALLNRPSILLADEPTGNLDSGTASEILRLLMELQAEENMAMLFVTHSNELIAQFPAATWRIENGRVMQDE